MPLYEYKCACGVTETAFRSVALRNDCPACECGLIMKKSITNSRVYGDLDYVEEGFSPHPVRIKGRRHLRRLMKEHDVVEKNSKLRWV